MNDQPMNPYPVEVVADLPISEARHELLEEIMSTSTEEHLDHTTAASGRRQRGLWAGAAVAAASVLAVLLVPLTLGGDSDRREGPTVPSEPTRPEASKDTATTSKADRARATGERAVLDAAGWEYIDVSEFSTENGLTGELDYAKGTSTLNIALRPEATYSEIVSFQDQAYGASEAVTLFGGTGRMWTRNEIQQAAVTPMLGDHYFLVRSEGTSSAEFRGLLDELRQVDGAAFTASLPTEVVTPAELSAAVRGLLADIEVPSGFEPALDRSPGYNSTDRLTFEMTGQVTCAWAKSWQRARQAGDDQAEQLAVSALAGSDDWDALRDIPASSGYSTWPASVADIAAQLADPTESDTLVVERSCPR